MGCRTYTLPRDDESSTPKGWIRENTKIGLVLQVTTNYHQGNLRIEVRIDSLSGDGSHSCVRIWNGLNTFVTDLTEKTRIHGDDENHSASTRRPVAQETRIAKHFQTEEYKPAAKLKPKPTSSPISSPSPTSKPVRERNWIDIEHQEPTQKDAPSFPISKRMITLLRHGTLPRNEDGAIEFWRLKMEFKSDFPNSVNWSIRMRIDHLQAGGGQKKRFQFCINSNGTQILYLRAIQGNSGENPVESSLQDNVLVLDSFFEFIYQVGRNFNMHSVIASGLIAGGRGGGKYSGRDRQTLFFTAVDPMNKSWIEQEELALTQPRCAACKQKWEISQDAVYWVDMGRVQRTGFKFFQTRSNAIISHNTFPSICTQRVVTMCSEEVLFS